MNAITSLGEDVFLGTDVHGGIGADPTTDATQVVAWAPRDREVLWSTPLPYAGVMGLTSSLTGRAGFSRRIN